MKKFRMARLLTTVLLVMTMVASMSACAPDQTNPSDGASTPGEASGSGENESLRTVTFGLQTATNSLPFYIAKEEGFFEEEGINAEFLVYTSGGAQIEAAASNAWMFGTGGVFPAITGMLNIDMRVVGSCMSDDAMVDLWVRPDSPIAQSGPGHCEE